MCQGSLTYFEMIFREVSEPLASAESWSVVAQAGFWLYPHERWIVNLASWVCFCVGVAHNCRRNSANFECLESFLLIVNIFLPDFCSCCCLWQTFTVPCCLQYTSASSLKSCLLLYAHFLLVHMLMRAEIQIFKLNMLFIIICHTYLYIFTMLEV